jgi:hypothetical protein
MKKLFGLIIICISLSAVAFAEDTKNTKTPEQQAQGPQITTNTNQACDLNALNAEKQQLVDQKKDIIAKIIAVKKQIRHCKGPGRVSKMLMDESKTKNPM